MNTATATATATAPPKMRTPIESGVPDNKPYLHCKGSLYNPQT